MRLTREELKRLLAPLAIAAALLGVGAALIWSAGGALRDAQARLGAAQAERRQSNERLARISEEEREVSQKIDVYQRLKSLNILGEERRLEWADAITRIRTQLPFDVTSEGTLTGDIGGAAESGEAPRFTVTLLRRLP